jgi:hypothetical protein
MVAGDFLHFCAVTDAASALLIVPLFSPDAASGSMFRLCSLKHLSAMGCPPLMPETVYCVRRALTTYLNVQLG